MADYRLFYLRDGRTIGEEDFKADSDGAAVVDASELRAGQAGEPWQGLRKIWTFDPHAGPDADSS